MAGNTKRVFYVKYLAAPDYAETLAQRPDVRLDKLENDSPDDVAAPVLSQAHAYQIGSARDEIATRFHATAALLGAHPEPADRLDQWRRLRHRQREGLHAGRRAGASTRRAATARRWRST